AALVDANASEAKDGIGGPGQGESIEIPLEAGQLIACDDAGVQDEGSAGAESEWRIGNGNERWRHDAPVEIHTARLATHTGDRREVLMAIRPGETEQTRHDTRGDVVVAHQRSVQAAGAA